MWLKINFQIFAVFSVLAALPGAAQSQNKETSRVIQPLTAGTVVSKKQQEDLGLIFLRTGFPMQGGWVNCSGILLANDWALTAGHCLDILEGKTTQVVTAFTPGTFTADAVYKFGAGAGDSAGPDIGLVHLSTPVSVNGSTRRFVTRFWTGEVVGKTVAVFGAGTAVTPGSYLAANMKAREAQGRNFLFNSGPSGEMAVPGDSGGPGIIWDNNTPFLVGIISVTGPPTLASIPAHHGWIVAVTKSRWLPSQSANSIEVQLDEINSTPWTFAPHGSQLDRVPWALAQRAATTLCMNRGMAGGHFDGWQDGVRFALQCSNRTNVVYGDATQADINATPWAFSDVNSVSWAHANRAAERLCANAGQNFAGGHFNGHQNQETKGLFCYKVNTQWFNAVGSDVTQFLGSPDLNSLPWPAAARTGTAYCRGKGYSGGFMNGHQVPGSRYGIVCQK